MMLVVVVCLLSIDSVSLTDIHTVHHFVVDNVMFMLAVFVVS